MTAPLSFTEEEAERKKSPGPTRAGALRRLQMEFDLDVPIPDSVGRSKYNFGEMPISASFALPKNKEKTLRTAASWWKRRHPDWNYIMRTVTENGERVVRLWRTA